MGLALFDEESDNLDVLFGMCTDALSQPVEIQRLLQLLDVVYVLLARVKLDDALGLFLGLLSCAMSQRVRARWLNQVCVVRLLAGRVC